MPGYVPGHNRTCLQVFSGKHGIRMTWYTESYHTQTPVDFGR